MKYTRCLLVALVLTALSAPLWASGGLGGSEDTGAETLKVSLKPVTNNPMIYGWVRVMGDQFYLGADALKPNKWYSVYFVNAKGRQAVGKNPVTQADGDGEVKFSQRLTQPLGAQWDKVVLYYQPKGQKDKAGMKPILEGSLK